MKTMKGQVSDFLILAGIIIIVGAMIFFASGFLGNIGAPESQKQSISGSVEKVSGRVGELVKECWSRSGGGTSASNIACFRLRINPDRPVQSTEVTEKLEGIPEDSVEIPGTLSRGTFKIRYDPEDQAVKVEPF